MYLNAVITKFEKIPAIFSIINHINIWFSLAIDMQIVLFAFIRIYLSCRIFTPYFIVSCVELIWKRIAFHSKRFLLIF